MLFGRLIETKKLTILKGFSNFFFLLYHLWYVYAYFTYAQVKYPLAFSLIMMNIFFFFLKEVLYLLNKIYRYMYVEDHVVEVAPPHTQSASSLREKRFKEKMFKLWGSKGEKN